MYCMKDNNFTSGSILKKLVNYPDPKGSKLAVKEYRGSSD